MNQEAPAKKKKTVALGAAGLVIAVMPSLIGYLQNRDEIKAKYAKTQDAAAHGYDALASSVKELQKVTVAQHDYIVKMQTQLEMMEKFVLSRTQSGSVSATGSGRPGRPPVAKAVVAEAPPEFPAPPPAPAYGKMPEDFSAAQMKH